jgi:hypothetical protein
MIWLAPITSASWMTTVSIAPVAVTTITSMTSMTKNAEPQLPKDQRVDALAKYIASHIFDIGVEGGVRPSRMEYKAGDWRTKEYGVGGLCEEAMCKYIAEAIRVYELELNPPVQREDIA